MGLLLGFVPSRDSEVVDYHTRRRVINLQILLSLNYVEELLTPNPSGTPRFLWPVTRAVLLEIPVPG